jgi:hypothetical protein
MAEQLLSKRLHFVVAQHCGMALQSIEALRYECGGVAQEAQHGDLQVGMNLATESQTGCTTTLVTNRTLERLDLANLVAFIMGTTPTSGLMS